MTRAGHVIYLHGFASSPASGKASRFARELAAAGVPFSCPDLNLPEFRTLTITRMLDQVHEAAASAEPAPLALIGSSLGALVAIHAAARQRDARIDRLILLAPAVDFGGNRLRQLGEHGIEEWRRAGSIPFFHYGLNRLESVDFELYTDAAQYDAFAATFDVPALVFHGRRDDLVDPAAVERWAADRPNVDLRMLDDDHQLTASFETLWKESRQFLELGIEN